MGFPFSEKPGLLCFCFSCFELFRIAGRFAACFPCWRMPGRKTEKGFFNSCQLFIYRYLRQVAGVVSFLRRFSALIAENAACIIQLLCRAVKDIFLLAKCIIYNKCINFLFCVCFCVFNVIVLSRLLQVIQFMQGKCLIFYKIFLYFLRAVWYNIDS